MSNFYDTYPKFEDASLENDIEEFYKLAKATQIDLKNARYEIAVSVCMRALEHTGFELFDITQAREDEFRDLLELLLS